MVLFCKKELLACCFITVAQHGAESGIWNHEFTTWLPAGQAFAGLSGSITLQGNAPGFSEALIVLGTAPDPAQTAAACAARNNTISARFPGINRLWAGILKSNNAAPATIAVALALPHPILASTPAGTCLTTLVSAGYPYLRRDAALYTTTTLHLTLATSRATATVQAFGMGGEFRFVPGTANYVGIQATRPLAIDTIAAAISAAPVTGAPPDAHWGPPPQGAWRVTTDFLYLPAPACNAAHFATHQPGPDYSILRLADPAPLSPPPGTNNLLAVRLASAASQAVQTTAFTTPAKRLNPGDCLFAYTAVPSNVAAEGLDVENQTTVYLRPLAP